MTKPTTLPDPVRAWAESTLGPLPAVRDASDTSSSRVWQVRRQNGERFFVKLFCGPGFFNKESFAYRHAVPFLGAGRAPRLVATSAQHLALILTDVRGTPLSQVRLTEAALETTHDVAVAGFNDFRARARWFEPPRNIGVLGKPAGRLRVRRVPLAFSSL